MTDSHPSEVPPHRDSDTVFFAILGMTVCAGLAAISGRLSSAPMLPWAAAAMGVLLALGVAVMRAGRRRAGRAMVAAVLTVLNPGLGQMSLGRVLRGSAILIFVAGTYLTGWWWTAYIGGLVIAALEFAEQRRADDIPPPELHVRLGQAALLIAVVLGAMAAFSISGGRARTGPGVGAIVVLGGGRVEIGYGKEDRYDSASAVRSLAAARLWSPERYERVYTVGTSGEARDMARVMLHNGVEGERISCLDAASTITSVPLIPAEVARPVIVTHRYHIARTDLFVRALGRCGGAEFHPVRSASWSDWLWMTARESLSLAAHLAALPWIAM